ncbi:MAG: phytase [Gemmatales bacterium]
MIRWFSFLLAAGLCTVALLASHVPNRAADDLGVMLRPEPRLETEPSRTSEDSYDDPAVWIHPQDPALSLILGTNKKGGLHLFQIDGRQLGVVSPKANPNNVDVIYGFPLQQKPTDLALSVCRDKLCPCVRVWKIDPATRTLVDISGPDGIKVLDGEAGYGSCTYCSRKTGKHYFFVNHKSGRYEQYVLDDAGDGKVRGRKVRSFQVSSQAEGCVADQETGALYVSEEAVGLWRFSAEEDGGDQGRLVARVGEHGLTADCEGVTIYYAAGGKGYVILSSQGNNTFKVYDRGAENAFIGTIDPAAGKLGKVSGTDGLDVTNRPLGPMFPQGALVVQDGTPRPGGQRFKFYAWEDVAGKQLIVDSEYRPR